ncbi:MAG TPA: uracil-DNA glycosylase, partial [Tissierellaceae bacterium]
IYPDYTDLFNALNYTPYENVKVVILGQDPYHGKDQANGLAFSVKEGIKIPPSLRNIFKELNSDLGYKIPLNGDLKKWAKEGVLLLNTSLTVIEAKANSHRNKGWEIFTDEIIKIVNKKETPVVFILWGNNAIEKEKFIDSSKHLILKAPHPSPLSSYRGFFDSKPFSKTNEFLIKNNLKQIDWDLN